MSGSYTERCARVMEELRSSDVIDVHTARLEPVPLKDLADPDWVFTQIGERTGMQLRASFEGHFFASERLQVDWESPSNDYLNGEFCLEPLLVCLFRNRVPQGSVQADLSDAQREIVGQLRIIDQEPMAGSGRLVGLRIMPGSENPELWLYDTSRLHTVLELLDLDYGSYLENVLITKGTYEWQYLFTDVDLRERRFRDTVQQLQRMLQVFPNIFPDYDYKDLRNRLAVAL